MWFFPLDTHFYNWITRDDKNSAVLILQRCINLYENEIELNKIYRND